jgi:hypothetical protein
VRLPTEFREQSRLSLPSPARIAVQSWRDLPTWWGGVRASSQPLEQCLQPWPVDLLSQSARGGVFQVMGFVNDEVVELGQQATSDLGVGQQ